MYCSGETPSRTQSLCLSVRCFFDVHALTRSLPLPKKNVFFGGLGLKSDSHSKIIPLCKDIHADPAHHLLAVLVQHPPFPSTSPLPRFGTIPTRLSLRTCTASTETARQDITRDRHRIRRQKGKSRAGSDDGGGRMRFFPPV